MRVSGEIVLQQVWDTGGEIDLEKVRRIFGKSPELAALKLEQAAPAYINIKPQPLFAEVKHGKVKILGKQRNLAVTTRIYSIGAVSLQLRIPFKGDMKELVKWAKPFDIGEKSARDFGEAIFKDILKEIRGALMSIYPREEMPEEYAVFVITKPRVKAVPFLSKNKALIAGILRAEPNWKSLSEKEVEEATSRWLTYFRSNLMVVDWSSAFILEPFANYEDFLTTIELANMQLLELRTYDKLIEQRVEKVEADLEHAIHGFPLFPPFGRLSADIADMRNELTRYIEDTINITKFFGDYTLAKLYDLLEQRLHIQEWYASVSKKLSTLEDMSKMAGSRFEARRANLLEALIVVLIVFEIYLAMRGIL